ERMVGYLGSLLASIAANPHGRIGELGLLNATEQHQLLTEFNPPPAAATTAALCLHQQFQRQAEAAPDRLAIVSSAQQVSYAELNRRANQLAHYLLRLGVGPEVRVGLCVERGVGLVVGLLGVLKSGGAYVPIDAGYPGERVAYMVEDAGVAVLLTQHALLDRFSGVKARLVCLDSDLGAVDSQDDTNPISSVAPENLMYVIYTSGSTGRPKGTLITHENTARLFEMTRPWFHFDQE